MSPKFPSPPEEEPLSDIQRLIRLKRFECPPEDAVDDFLIEFNRRQRSQALTGSSRKLFAERLSTYLSSFGKQRWIYGGLAAYSCVMLFFLVRPSLTPMGTPDGGGGAVPVRLIQPGQPSDDGANPGKPLPMLKKKLEQEVIVL